LSASTRHEPVRTCVGCRQPDRQVALVRIARTTAGVALDPRRRLSGRGAWLHRDPRCWRGARAGLARTLKCEVTQRDVVALADDLASMTADAGLQPRDVVDIAPRSKA